MLATSCVTDVEHHAILYENVLCRLAMTDVEGIYMDPAAYIQV